MEDDFAQRVRKLVDEAGGQTALARKTGMSPGAIQRYLRGGDPTRAVLIRMAQVCGVSLEWLVYGRDETPTILPSGTAPLPLYGFSDTGQQGWYTEVRYRIGASLDWPDPEIFAIVAPDSAMAPEGIRAGFVCFVSPNTRPNRNDAVFIRKKDETSAIRRYLKSESGWIHVEGFLDPKDGGPPVPLRENLKSDTLDLMGTIVAIRRRN
ncbi:MAG: helix-turn-helix transcriptional regulator [Rhodospirillales bacterium]|nr:helix-turn-helix transcriptional regulator [Rhodospirillales bacterium]